MPFIDKITLRDALDGDQEELHLECRFSDGQKYAAIRLDNDEIGNDLAKRIIYSLEGSYV